jgi:hypothetical protein
MQPTSLAVTSLLQGGGLTRKQRLFWFLVVAAAAFACLVVSVPRGFTASLPEGTVFPYVARAVRGMTQVWLASLFLLGLVAGVLEPRRTPEASVPTVALLITAAASAPLFVWNVADMLVPGGEGHNLFPLVWCAFLLYGSFCGAGFVLSAGLWRVLRPSPDSVECEPRWVQRALMLGAIAVVGIGAKLVSRPVALPTAAFAAGALLSTRTPASRLRLLATMVGAVAVLPAILVWAAGILASGGGTKLDILLRWYVLLFWATASAVAFRVAIWLRRTIAARRCV